MNTLAIDLGSSTGFAIFKDGTIISGVKKLQHSKHASGLRFLDFRNWLIETIKTHGINEIYYERVYRHLGTDAAHVYGGFMYVLAAVCEEFSVKCAGIPVTTIKKLAAGKGNATKEDMISFARANGFNPANDDEADALAILFVALNLPNKNNDFINKQDSFWDLSDRAQRVFQ